MGVAKIIETGPVEYYLQIDLASKLRAVEARLFASLEARRTTEAAFNQQVTETRLDELFDPVATRPYRAVERIQQDGQEISR